MKAAIFDFNGTLFYDTPIHEAAWKTFGSRLLGRPVTEEEFQKSMLGRNNRKILEFLLQRNPTDREVEKLGAEKEESYRSLCLETPDFIHLAPGAEAFLDALKEREIPRTIATSSEITNIRFYFEYFPLSHWFERDKVVFEDGTLPGKPDPTIYRRAAGVLNTPPKDCMVFEDALSGIQAARNAGIGEIVAVASSMEPEFFKNVPGVTHVIRDYHEAWTLLD